VVFAQYPSIVQLINERGAQLRQMLSSVRDLEQMIECKDSAEIKVCAR